MFWVILIVIIVIIVLGVKVIPQSQAKVIAVSYTHLDVYKRQ